MYPKETAAFSTPPDRDGTNAILGPDANGNGGDYTGDGDKTVTLIDNVRDDNFYTFPAAPTYIAGFFSVAVQRAARPQRDDDRRVRLGAPHRRATRRTSRPTTCAPAARRAPNLYEGTFAHEWQHLLHYYTDPFEGNWINEGLSDFAQTLTGYVDATRTVFDRGADSHIYCFQGFGIGADAVQPQPARLRRPGELADPVGRGRQPERGAGRLRQRVLVHAVPVRPVRRGHHVPAAPRRRAAGPRRASTPRWTPRASRTCTR